MESLIAKWLHSRQESKAIKTCTNRGLKDAHRDLYRITKGCNIKEDKTTENYLHTQLFIWFIVITIYTYSSNTPEISTIGWIEVGISTPNQRLDQNMVSLRFTGVSK